MKSVLVHPPRASERRSRSPSLDAFEARLNTLHQLALDGDVGAMDALSTECLPVLKRRLQVLRFRDVCADQIHDAAIDALLEYFGNPQRYDPAKSALGSYLYVGARRNLLNVLRAARRRAEREAAFAREVRRLACTPGRYESGRATLPPLPVVVSGFTDAERTVVRLWLGGERQTDAFARALSLTGYPVIEQRAIVRRVKERVKRRLQRLPEV